jgi:hypothetical protein
MATLFFGAGCRRRMEISLFINLNLYLWGNLPFYFCRCSHSVRASAQVTTSSMSGRVRRHRLPADHRCDDRRRAYADGYAVCYGIDTQRPVQLGRYACGRSLRCGGQLYRLQYGKDRWNLSDHRRGGYVGLRVARKTRSRSAKWLCRRRVPIRSSMPTARARMRSWRSKWCETLPTTSRSLDEFVKLTPMSSG